MEDGGPRVTGGGRTAGSESCAAGGPVSANGAASTWKTQAAASRFWPTAHIQAINASDEFAALVGIAPGTAMLLMTRVGYLEDNTPIEVTDTYCRNDYYDFVAELRR